MHHVVRSQACSALSADKRVLKLNRQMFQAETRIIAKRRRLSQLNADGKGFKKVLDEEAQLEKSYQEHRHRATGISKHGSGQVDVHSTSLGFPISTNEVQDDARSFESMDASNAESMHVVFEVDSIVGDQWQTQILTHSDFSAQSSSFPSSLSHTSLQISSDRVSFIYPPSSTPAQQTEPPCSEPSTFVLKPVKGWTRSWHHWQPPNSSSQP